MEVFVGAYLEEESAVITEAGKQVLIAAKLWRPEYEPDARKASIIALKLKHTKLGGVAADSTKKEDETDTGVKSGEEPAAAKYKRKTKPSQAKVAPSASTPSKPKSGRTNFVWEDEPQADIDLITTGIVLPLRFVVSCLKVAFNSCLPLLSC